MIIFFTGTPGSGKTYEAVKKIVKNLQDGRKVYTNIDGMEDPVCQETMKCYLDLDDHQFNSLFHHLGTDREVIENFWDHCEPGSLIVLDEIQKYFSNRDWQTEKNKEFGNWASTHRHEGYDLVIITQAAERVDSAVRALIEWNYVFRKVNFFGGAVQKKYLCNAFSGESTQGPPLSKSVRTYNPKIFHCYKSYVATDTKELSVMQHVNVLKHPIFIVIPLMIGLCIYMVFFKSSFGKGDLFGVDAIQAENFSLVEEAQATTHDQLTPENTPAPVALSSSPDVPPAPLNSRKVSLNYLQLTRRSGESDFKILFNKSVYTLADFPYPVTIENNHLYAQIPLAALEEDVSEF